MIEALALLWSADAAWGWLAPGPAARPAAVGVAAILGLCLGSFVNVLIHRLPRGESIVWPASRCPECREKIRPWDNLPVLSYLLLSERCRYCRVAIPWRYPVVEGLGGVVVAGATLWLGVSAATLGVVYFALCLLAVGWIDHEHRLIPDTLSVAMLAGGLAVRGASPEGVAVALLGAVLGSGALFGVAWTYRRVRGADGLGGGDVKLAAGLGAFLGPPGVALTVFLAALACSVVGMALIASRRGDGRTALPFGSFLAPAAVFVLVAGPGIWRTYLGWSGYLAGR